MSPFTSKSNTNYHVRSISLPARSHPTTIKIEQVLNKLKTRETTYDNSYGEEICNKLCGLNELYVRVEELLVLEFTRRAFAQHKCDKRVNELMEESVRFIDICSNTRETVVVIKETVKDVQSALRRRKIGDLDAETTNVAAYIHSRKKMQKEIGKVLTMLKHIDGRLISVPLSNSDDQFSATLKVLTETSVVTTSTFQSLLLFLSVPVLKPKLNRWSLVSKIMHKGALECEGQKKKLNELENVDIALSKLLLSGSCKSEESENIDLMVERLKALETNIEGLESVLEKLFGHLIHTRVSLLNIFSQ